MTFVECLRNLCYSRIKLDRVRARSPDGARPEFFDLGRPCNCGGTTVIFNAVQIDEAEEHASLRQAPSREQVIQRHSPDEFLLIGKYAAFEVI